MDRPWPLRAAVTRALSYLEEQLDAPPASQMLSLEEIARAAHMSAYHFHREFRAAVGEPVARYLTRRRLERAALALAYEPWRAVTDVALTCGFSSPSNFAKAFRAHFGCSPSALRAPLAAPARVREASDAPVRAALDPRALFEPVPAWDTGERAAIARAWDSRVRFERSVERHFACLAGPGGYGVDVLKATWSRLLGWARQLELTDAGGGIDAWGCAFDSPALTAHPLRRYHACVPCAPGTVLPEPLFRGRLRAGRYAVFTWEGPLADMERAYREIFSCWFPEAALTFDGFAPWERHIGDGPAGDRILLELWFKVRPRARR